MNDDGIKDLMVAVVRQAVMDYENAIYHYNVWKHPDMKQNAGNRIMECELFFKKNISAYIVSEINGEALILQLRSRVRKKLAKMGIDMEVPTNDD